MKKVSVSRVIKLAGAYIAYLIGSGFASGQEIMQFYTGYGYKGLIGIAISAVLFIWVGLTVMRAGFEHKGDGDFKPYRAFCGKIPGRVFEIFAYVYLFCIVVVMISGAGASISEYFGLNHYVGSLIMAVLVFVSIAFGLKRLIDAIGIIGPVVVIFTIIVCVITLIKHGDGFMQAGEAMKSLEMQTPAKSFAIGGVLYAAYNLICSILFLSALGGQTETKKEAVMAAILGGSALVLTILMMNMAFLSRISEVAVLEIPTLLLANDISPILGTGFLIVLLCGIFSTAAPMTWTFCDWISPENKSKKRRLLTYAIVTVAAFICGLLPFGKLVGIIYPISGYMGIAFMVLLIVYSVSKLIKKKRRPEDTETAD